MLSNVTVQVTVLVMDMTNIRYLMSGGPCTPPELQNVNLLHGENTQISFTPIKMAYFSAFYHFFPWIYL